MHACFVYCIDSQLQHMQTIYPVSAVSGRHLLGVFISATRYENVKQTTFGLLNVFISGCIINLSLKFKHNLTRNIMVYVITGSQKLLL